MEILTMVAVNIPLLFVSLLINLFFIYCLFSPRTSGKIKQPLKILLETMISCTVVYLLSMVVKTFTDLLSPKLINGLLFLLLSLWVASTSMTSSVWLNLYYYTQIVPAKNALSVWIKKNIKVVIYSAWIFERAWTLTDVTFLVVELNYLAITNVSAHALKVYLAFNCLFKIYLFISMFAMAVTSASISLYLFRHMQRMQGNEKSSFSSTFNSQLRVAINGAVQGLLYLLCGTWIITNFVYEKGFMLRMDSDIHYTLINVYMGGTSLNMWIGQTVFRHTSVDVARALKERRLICGQEVDDQEISQI